MAGADREEKPEKEDGRPRPQKEQRPRWAHAPLLEFKGAPEFRERVLDDFDEASCSGICVSR